MFKLNRRNALFGAVAAMFYTQDEPNGGGVSAPPDPEPQPEPRATLQPEPDPTPEPDPEPRQPVQPAPQRRESVIFQPQPLNTDDVEAEFDRAITAVDADEMLSPGDKAARRAGLIAQKAAYRDSREQKQERQFDRQQASDRAWFEREGARHDVSADRAQEIWAEAKSEQEQELAGTDPRVIQGATLATFRQKIAAEKPAPANNNPDDANKPAPARQVGSTRSIPRQARQAPAPPVKKLTVQEMIDQGKLPPEIEKQLAAELA